MLKAAALVVASGAALIAPLLTRSATQPGAAPAFSGWPSQLDGRPLHRLPDSAEERRFYAALPVRHARFGDGRRVVLLRWAGERVDGFHLADTCFQAFGFVVRARTRGAGPDGRAESCFTAQRGGETRRVCEHIRDGNGRVYADVSSWRLARLLGTAPPPFLGVSVVE